jgi:hypothetical protein
MKNLIATMALCTLAISVNANAKDIRWDRYHVTNGTSMGESVSPQTWGGSYDQMWYTVCGPGSYVVSVTCWINGLNKVVPVQINNNQILCMNTTNSPQSFGYTSICL